MTIWKPSLDQLLLIAEHDAARSPPGRIAESLNITEDEFAAWHARLKATRSFDAARLEALTPMPDIGRIRREHARMVGERLFEGEPEDDAA
jgi:hypothetical protein